MRNLHQKLEDFIKVINDKQKEMQEHQTEVEKVQKQDKEFTARTIAIFQRINDADIIIVMFFMEEYVNKNVLVPNYKGESFVLNVPSKWHNPLGQVALIDWYRRLFDQRPKNGEIENDQVFEDLERLQRPGEVSSLQQIVVAKDNFFAYPGAAQGNEDGQANRRESSRLLGHLDYGRSPMGLRNFQNYNHGQLRSTQICPQVEGSS
ncbi:hypothetical protein L3Y34_017450 [Caenorhabditis briggsae]|uniref:Uncharacterized protein n=1 Tax=Caenorhabditis briggsae TaxID=6238 RepID=A0AAE9DHV5_CAEBR|nr:hypothetical protein L3Y34_017450 [Caenorhabditis briggsae]